jgi:trimeric autotransporter adhesin
MTLLSVWRSSCRGTVNSRAGIVVPKRWRRPRTSVRRLTSVLMSPVLAGATFLVPVAVTASVAAAVSVAGVVKAAPAKAQSGPSVAVVLVNGESSAPEAALLDAAGYNAVPVTPATLAAMNQTTFDTYAAVVIGDSSTSSSCATTAPSTSSLGTNWEPWISGNVAVLGTAPAMPGTSGGDALITDAVAYAVASYNSNADTGTGLYLSLNCGYSTAASGTDVSLLDGVKGIGPGGVTVNGNVSCTDTGIVNTWEADAAGTFGGFSSSSLGTGTNAFPSPACPVDEAFDAWPAMFTPVAYDASSNPDVTANFTASDGVTGQPYILLGNPASVSSNTAALAPSTGGEVPAGATVGGGGNAAAPGISQAMAADPVDTENGDFTQSDTDFSIPTFGPGLDFTRTYDADLAEQQTQAGTPGPLGYGWTDDWASSLATNQAVPGDIYTIDGLATNTGFGGPAAQAVVSNPAGVYVDSSGNVYMADSQGNRVLEVAASDHTQWGISMTQGDVYVIAGSPTGKVGSTDGKPAANTLLSDPVSVAMDNSGDLFIADYGNDRVMELTASATPWGNMASPQADYVYRVAGIGGNRGDGPDGEEATSSDLDGPTGVYIGGKAAGNLYIADSLNNRIQMVPQINETNWGQAMTAYDVYTVAGSAAGASGSSGNGGPATSALLDGPEDMTIDSSENLLIADTDNCRVQEVAHATGTQWGSISMTAKDIYTVAGRNNASCTGGANNKAATSSDMDYPTAVADPAGNLYIADTNSNVIKEVADATGSQYGQSMTIGYVYAVAGTTIAGFSGNGGPAISAKLDAPEGVAVDSSGNVYVADTANNQIREASASSPYDITDLAGNGYIVSDLGDSGPATQAALLNPDGVAVDAQGNLYIADAGNNRVQEIAASSHAQFGISMTAGDTYTIAGSATGASGASGNGTPATSGLLNVPTSVAVDGIGDVYICDADNDRIVEVAATSHSQYGISMTAGDIYTVAGSATGNAGDSGDGGPAASALLNLPSGVAVDKAGDLFIADTTNSRVQEVPATSGTQYGIAMTAGDMYTIAGSATGAYGTSGDGGPGTSALLSNPFGVSVDAAGNVYVADSGNNRVQELAASPHTQWGQAMQAGYIYTMAGSAAGTSGDSGDGGRATSADLDYPTDVAADSSGDAYIVDEFNNQIREVAAANGTQWGQPMTANDIYTVAGSAAGTAGDGCPAGNPAGGCPATSALLDFPIDVGTDPAGNLYIPDQDTSTVLEVAATTNPTFPIYPAGGTTVTQPGGAQVTFAQLQSGGTCSAGLVLTSNAAYCVPPAFQDATLTSNTSNDTYTFVPSPGSDTYIYSWGGQLISETDTAGATLTITYDSPVPGQSTSTTTAPITSTAIACPSTATYCDTIDSASGRALVIGSNSVGLVTSVTDPMGREWTYAYNSSDQLISARDPMGNVTSYTYGQDNNGLLQANDLLTITEPNAQPGGPDAGDSTVNIYDKQNRVTSQTDPMGYTTTFDYCVNASIIGDCMNTATGTGLVTVTDPDDNTTAYTYDQGTVTAQADWTGAVGATMTSQQINVPDTTVTAPEAGCPGNTDGSLLVTASFDGDNYETTDCNDALGDVLAQTSPSGGSTPSGTETTSSSFTSAAQLDQQNCAGTAEASSGATCEQAPGPAAMPAGQPVSPPTAAPPDGLTYTMNDTYGNELYSTAGVYSPAGTYEYSQTSYQLYDGNTVTLPGSSGAISCSYASPSMSLPCATIDADGNVTQLEYNTQGDLIASSTPDGNGTGVATTTYAYDADGEQTSTVSPDGNVAGANAGNYTTTADYNADGDETSVTQGGGSGYTDTPRTTSYGYDGDGNKTTVTDARGYTTTTSYNGDDEATLVTDPDGHATLTCYDGDGNKAQTVPPVGVAANNLTASSCPTIYPASYTDRLAADVTTSTYDADGNQTATSTPAPAGQTGYETTTYTYDGDGNLLTTTAPPTSDGGPGQVTVDTYNTAGELATETTGYGSDAASTTSYCYDPNGDQTSVVMPDGNTGGAAPCETSSPWIVSASSYPTQAAYQTTSSYDAAGDEVSTTSPATSAAPNGATTSYTYDANGNTLTSTDPDGVITTWTYTPDDQIATITYSGSSAHDVSYSYDANGQTTTMADATGTSAYAYDPFGELISAQNGAGQVVSYSYDADGDNTGITYPLPSTATWAATDTVNYGYDKADQLTSVTDFTNHQIAITNTADGLPSTVALGSTGDTISTSYDQTDSPSAITLKNSSGALQSFTYTDAPAGNILSETDGPGSQSAASYTYDAKGRVLSMTPVGSSTVLSYSFDASGNLTTLPTGANAANGYNDASQLTASTLSGTTTNYTYNADGERLTSAQGSTTETSGTWNGADQLAAYSNPAAAMSSASYDGNGMRLSATFTPAGGPPVTESFVWAADNLLMDSANAYIYTDGTAPAEQVNLVTGAIAYLTTDSLGSVRGTVSSSGALSGTTSYDAWGNPETMGGLTATTPFGFAGGYTDPDGLIYLINRYYDPATGQFTSIDPDVSQTLEPYAYTEGNPVSNTDPTGDRQCCLPNCKGCGSPPPKNPYKTFKERERYAVRYYVSHLKLAHYQAGGVVGNLVFESGPSGGGLNPRSVQDGCTYPESDPTAFCGVGIAQWTYNPVSYDHRWVEEGDFAKHHHASRWSYPIQVQFVVWELTSKMEYPYLPGGASTLSDLKQARSLDTATASFEKNYENPANPASTLKQRETDGCNALKATYGHC